jgi:hypothetical protein
MCSTRVQIDPVQALAEPVVVRRENVLMDLSRHLLRRVHISRTTEEKIYHLPMDRSYDFTVIEPQLGELYTESVAQAESLGFRRSLRWRSP